MPHPLAYTRPVLDITPKKHSELERTCYYMDVWLTMVSRFLFELEDMDTLLNIALALRALRLMSK